MTTDSTCRVYRANGAEIDRDTDEYEERTVSNHASGTNLTGCCCT
jgi:hypothetical protein